MAALSRCTGTARITTAVVAANFAVATGSALTGTLGMTDTVRTSTTFSIRVAQAVAIAVFGIGAEAIYGAVRADTIVAFRIASLIIIAAQADAWVILVATFHGVRRRGFALNVAATLYTGSVLASVTRCTNIAGAAATTVAGALIMSSSQFHKIGEFQESNVSLGGIIVGFIHVVIFSHILNFVGIEIRRCIDARFC